MRPQAVPVVHIEDNRFRATEWRFAPGAETGWHRHGHDYVIVPLTDGALLIEEPGGVSRDAALAAHVPYSRREGVEHNVVNAAAEPLAFLEVEVVDDVLARNREATLARFLAAWNARDIDAAMACMAAECAYQSAEGGAPRHVGRGAVRAAYAATLEAWPEASWRGARHHVAGEAGVSNWRFAGLDRNGRKAEGQGCDLFTFEGELIAIWDSYRKG